MIRLILVLLFLTQTVFGARISIDVIPESPVAQESFNIVFKINTKNGSDPVIQFDPVNVEVLSRQETGTSTRTTYINGKLTVERTINVSYELVAPRNNRVILKNISVKVGGETLTHPNFSVKVLKSAPVEKDVFVRAEVDKDEVYLNESIIVRYYLYSRYPTTSLTVDKFPKLDKFLKRFHQENGQPQQVQLATGIYRRQVIYSAQLFANKTGKFKIDPISLSVTYPYGGGLNSFGFGFRSSRQRKKTLRSTPVEILVKKLPSQTPNSFTGLVGEHEFKFNINKTKFLVNEAIELDFSVKGEGALELYEEPKFFTSSKVEEFDSTSDLTVEQNFSATKSFKITYLAREAGIIPARESIFSFFDPSSLEFKSFTAKIPEIKIAGTIASNTSSLSDKVTPQKKIPVAKSVSLDPIYKLKNTLVYEQRNIIALICLILLLLIVIEGVRQFLKFKKSKEETVIETVDRKGASYALFYELLRVVDYRGTAEQIIKKLPLEIAQELNEKKDKLDTAYKEGRKIRVKISKKTLKWFEKHARA